MQGSSQTTRSITKIYEIRHQKNKRRNIKTTWWTPFEPYADNTMYKTSLLEGPGRHHRKNRYTSHEMDEFLKKVIILLARHDHPTLRHCAGASKRRVPNVKKEPTTKRPGLRGNRSTPTERKILTKLVILRAREGSDALEACQQ